jgi:hypothetical protein
MRIRSLAGVVVLLAVLAGCAPPSIGAPVPLPDVLREGASTGEFPAVWEPPHTLTVVLGGSSSCPTIATGIDERDGVVRLTLHRSTNLVCTTDLVTTPVAFVLEGGRPDSVVLLLDGEEHPLELVDQP